LSTAFFTGLPIPVQIMRIFSQLQLTNKRRCGIMELHTVRSMSIAPHPCNDILTQE